MARLIAEKSHSYGTRRLKAGDEYEASEMHAKVLVAARLARLPPEKAASRPSPAVKHEEKAEATAQAAVVNPASGERPEDIDRLRGEARRLGIEVDGRWGTVRLKYEIAQAKSR